MVGQVALVMAAVDKQIAEGIANVVIDLVQRLIAQDGSGTPRDTGWAATNWTASIAVARVGTVGTRADAVAGNISDSTQKSSLAAIRTGYTSLSKGDVHINNNVRYIAKLNAVNNPMFVERAVAQAVLVF